MAAEPRVVFRHTVEAFLSRVFIRRGLLQGAVKAQLLALGVDPAHPRDTPVPRWRQVVKLAADTIAPGQPEADAMREVGREMIRGFEASLVGRSLFIVQRIIGMKRMLETLAHNYRNADNATEVVVRELGPRDMELRFKVAEGIPWPTYTEGIILEAARAIGIRDEVRVGFRVESPSEVTYRVTW
ncbi:MAG: DUF2378 family protein [Myxococcota bacterium]